MIWGLILEPGKIYTEVFHCEIHLSMASLESRRGKGSNSEDFSQVIVKTAEREYLLCTLAKGIVFQQYLDFVLKPQDQVSFFVEGSNTVHLTGYYQTSADQACQKGTQRLHEDVPRTKKRDVIEMHTGEVTVHCEELSSAESYSDDLSLIVKQEPADEREPEFIQEDGVEEIPNIRSKQSQGSLTGRNSGEKRCHEMDDGFIPNDELPMKKVCPSKMPSAVLSPSQQELPSHATSSQTLDNTTHAGQGHSSTCSPIPLPLFSGTVAMQQSQVTPSLPSIMPEARLIQPSSSLLVYQTAPSVSSVPSQKSMTVMNTSNSLPNLANCDPPITQSQMLENQKAILSTINALTEKVNTMEKTILNLNEILTKLHAKSPKSAKATNPVYVNNLDGSVQIGDENGKIVLNKAEVDTAFNLSLTGKDFVLKMMSIAFTAEELAVSNYSGGRTICGSEIKHKTPLSDHWKFKAILACAESNFPGSTTDGHMFKVLKDAVNNKCRKLDSKIKHGQM